jgi:integrase
MVRQTGQPRTATHIRTAISRTGVLSNHGMKPRNISDLVKRRFKDAGLPETLKAHSFRATTITNLLSQDGIGLDAVKDLARHADARTTRGYDRSNNKVNRNLVERISL